MSVQQPFDPESTKQSRQQFRAVAAGIAELAGTEIGVQEFYAAFLARIVAALSAAAGAIWARPEREKLEVLAQVNFNSTGLMENAAALQQHSRLIGQVFSSGEGTLVPAHAILTDDAQTGNPTSYPLVLWPLKADGRVQSVVEIFRQNNQDEADERGNTRFVIQMCEMAVDFIKSREIKRLNDQNALWSRLQQFTHAVQQSLDLKETAYTLANEACRLIQCDRVSVAVCHRSRVKIEAVSGQDLVDSRANAVRLLANLAQRVIATGETLWYTGDGKGLPPQIEEVLHAYIDESHTRTLGVVPLAKPQPAVSEEEYAQEPEIVGALIVERIDESGLAGGLQERTEFVRQQGTPALVNALTHERVFLMPVWKTLAKSRWFVEARRLPKTLIALGIVLAAAVALAIIPADFLVTAQGTLQPSERRDVFVQESGVVSDVLVDHGQSVDAGTPLIRLRSRDLEVAITDLQGRKAAMLEQISSLHRARGEARLSYDERNRLSGQFEQLQKSYDSLSEQLLLSLEKQELLTVRSPLKGQVVTWDLRNRLRDRPVERGQLMLSVVNPKGPWELELLVPEDRAGYVAAAFKNVKPPDKGPRVGYILATDPSTTRTGTAVEIHSSAEVRGEEGNTVLVRVEIKPDSLDAVHLRPGAAVTARIDCGRRSLGYVWFHDVLSFIRSKILFRL